MAVFSGRRINASGSPLACLLPGTGSLVTAFRSPATAAASRRPPFRGQSSRPATSLPSLAASAARSALRLRYRSPVCPGPAASLPLARCSFHDSARPAAPPISTPLRDFYLPRDQSVQPDLLPAGPPSESARFPFAPRCRFLLLVFRLRINVPGPLRFRRLAVPQTSWNLLHYAPECLCVNRFCHRKFSFSSTFFSFCFESVTEEKRVNCL